MTFADDLRAAKRRDYDHWVVPLVNGDFRIERRQRRPYAEANRHERRRQDAADRLRKIDRAIANAETSNDH